MNDWDAGGYNFDSDGLSDNSDYMKGLDVLAENFDDIDGFEGLSNEFEDSSKLKEDSLDGWEEDLDLSIDMFEAAEDDLDSNDDDDMAKFEEECARRLAAEHARRAAEANINKSGAAALNKITPTEENKENVTVAVDASSELSQVMKTESYQQQRHVDDLEMEEGNEEGKVMPKWMRVLLSALLIALGAVGVWMLTVNSYNSYLLDPICFTEIALCLMAAVGINAALISDRSRKTTIMRIALWCIFLFYCLYAADILFLDRMLKLRFNIGDFAEFARNNINFDIFRDLAKMKILSIIECIVFIMPYAFCVPVLIKSYRNIFLYFLYMTFSVLVAGTLRIITQTGGVSIAQCLMCLVGAAVSYIIFMLPPMQNVLRSSGLLEWIEVADDDE